MTSLQLAMAFTLKAEGLFTVDNGGPTMYGVTQSVYDKYRLTHKLDSQSVAHISMEEVEEIMTEGYWKPAHCMDMPEKLGIATFDWAYNHGVKGAIETLQKCLGVAYDGVFGPNTKAALAAAPPNILLQFLDARRAWYEAEALHYPATFNKDLRGWLNRVDALEIYLHGLEE